MLRRLERVRIVTRIVLVTNAVAGLFLPAVGLWREPDAMWTALGVLGIVLFCAAQAAALHALVTPWLTDRTRRRAKLAFAVASAASLPLVGPVGGDWPTWSWLAACIVGMVPVLTGKVRAAVLGTVTVALALVVSS